MKDLSGQPGIGALALIHDLTAARSEGSWHDLGEVDLTEAFGSSLPGGQDVNTGSGTLRQVALLKRLMPFSDEGEQVVFPSIRDRKPVGHEH